MRIVLDRMEESTRQSLAYLYLDSVLIQDAASNFSSMTLSRYIHASVGDLRIPSYIRNMLISLQPFTDHRCTA